MKKKIIVSVAVAALLLVGCSKQPNLENAENVSSSKPKVEKTQPSKKTEQNKSEALNEKNETLNTENAEVEEENLNVENLNIPKVSVKNTNQDFAKKLSSIVVYFDFDKYNIRPDQWPKVEKLAKLIKSNPSNYTVRIEGNTDEWGTEEYNYALGLKRANSVRNALIKLGVDPKKLTVISYGELNPVCTAHARWCWRLNRRDNFTYLP